MTKTTEEKIKVMKAYEEGKKIICLNKYGVKLCDYYKPKEITDPSWNWLDYDYQVQEELKPKYRPYKDIDELFKDWAEKTHNVPANMEKLVRPLIWVKRDVVDYYEGLITLYYSDNTILIGEQVFNLAQLFERFTFLDGSPCGKKE